MFSKELDNIISHFASISKGIFNDWFEIWKEYKYAKNLKPLFEGLAEHEQA